ncbi:MAG: hypothetical protein IT567_04430 [Alphaproteobacteria bacterium]|nr:hypothetical protein [Alphaproteobacteria bacterium]
MKITAPYLALGEVLILVWQILMYYQDRERTVSLPFAVECVFFMVGMGYILSIYLSPFARLQGKSSWEMADEAMTKGIFILAPILIWWVVTYFS